MESAAVTTGTLGDASATFRSAATCTASTVICDYINHHNNNNRRTTELWENQKMDFSEGRCETYSSVVDEMFLLHLLEIHAKYCAELSCKQRSWNSGDNTANFELEQNLAPESSIFTSLPNSNWPSTNFTEEEKLRVTNTSISVAREASEAVPNASQYAPAQGPTEPDWDSILPISSDARDVKIATVKTELTDMSSHDQIETPDTTSQNQKESPDPLSHDHHIAFNWNTRNIKQEKNVNKGGSELSGSTRDIENAYLAPKLHLRKMPAKCAGCHKVLHGSGLQYSVGGHYSAEHKCDKCKEDYIKTPTTGNQAMDTTESDMIRENANHSSHLDTSFTDIKSANLEKGGFQESETHGENFTCPNPEVPERDDLHETMTGSSDDRSTDELGEIHETKSTGGYDKCGPGGDRCSTSSSNVSTHTKPVAINCRECSETFSYQCQLVAHMRTHTGERPFSCSICSKVFAKKAVLKKHVMTHTGERPFSCSICSKAFAYKAVLTAHLMTHTGERPFSCSICSKSFARKSVHTKHMRTHTGERPFSCSICRKAFTQKGGLTTHMRTHTGERPFSCSICGKAFKHKSNLTTHMIVHNGERPFSCSICSKSFAQKSPLTRHMKRHTSW